MQANSFPRRQFLKGSGALIVSFSFLGPAARAFAQSRAASNPDLQPTSLDSWIAVAQNGNVTVFTSKVELGTGVQTALGQIVAEELDVPFAHVTIESGDTIRSVDQAVTAASRTLERGGPQLRQAAAAARRELLKLASARLDAPAEKLMVTDGVVSVVGSTAKKVSYGELIGGRHFDVQIVATGTGWDLKVAPDVPAKSHQDYKIVGTSVPRVDLPAKFAAEFTYSQDVRVPGMLHGRVVRPPVVNSKPSSVDEGSVKGIPGVVKIVQEGGFVGVVAETEWAAIRAASALKVNWSTPSTKLPHDMEEVYSYLKNTKSYTDQAPVKKGDVDAALAQSSRTFGGTFRWPFQLHGMLGPSCAVADVQGDMATVWSGSQGPFNARKAVAAVLKVPENNIRIIYREGSGCYGRLEDDDVALDAAVMSRAAGKPVRVQWMRGDEHGWEPKGPAQFLTVRAGVDAQGKVVAWDFMDRSFPWTEALPNPWLAGRQIGLKPTAHGFLNGAGAGGETYLFDNQRIVAASIPWIFDDPTPLRTSNLRAPGELARCFASESTMDEIASAIQVDPVQFRLRYLNHNARFTEVLQAAAKQAAWKERPSPAPQSSGPKAAGRGVALVDRANSYVAAIAEVEVDKATGKISVQKVTIAHDCGFVVNPDGLKNQIEGNVIQGVSRTLLEQVLFDESGVKSLDWISYPILTFRQIPDIDIVLLHRTDMQPLGGGESSIGPIPAAISNAVFDAIGVRLREAPLTPQRVLSALQAQQRPA